MDAMLELADHRDTTYIDGSGGWDSEGLMAGEIMFPDGVGCRFVPQANLEELTRAADVDDVERMLALSVEMEESGSVEGGV
ncbi:hypothetical protein [Nonomuraea sp. NPDC049480]|uniref:hypothetical protein n=1 Tax=Nonomuraea sp. NPDC049480 TaxID=3364353 RepID=UPI0037A29E11